MQHLHLAGTITTEEETAATLAATTTMIAAAATEGTTGTAEEVTNVGMQEATVARLTEDARDLHHLQDLLLEESDLAHLRLQESARLYLLPGLAVMTGTDTRLEVLGLVCATIAWMVFMPIASLNEIVSLSLCLPLSFSSFDVVYFQRSSSEIL